MKRTSTWSARCWFVAAAIGCGSERAAPPTDARPADAPLDAPAADAGAVDAPLDAAPRPAIVEVPCAGAALAATIETGPSSYSPRSISIAPGATVRFAPTNPHDVKSGTPADPLPWFQVDGNDPRCLRFDDPGAFVYFCQAHPTMTGEVIVTTANALK